MEQRQELLLRFCDQINHQVAAAKQVQVRKRRINQNILYRKDHAVPDFLSYAKKIPFFDEKALQALRAHLGCDAGWKKAFAGFFDGIFVDIRSEQLQADLPGDLVEALAQDNHQRIDLLARGASRNPGPENGAFLHLLEKLG